MFKERPLDTLFSRDLLQMLLLLALWAHASSTVFKVRQRSKNCKLSLHSRFFSTVFWSFETNKNGDIVTLSLQFSFKCSIFKFPFIKRKSRALLVDFARAVRLPLRSVRTTSTYPYHAAQSVFQAHDWLGSVLFLLSLAYCAVCQNINERL